MVESIKAVCIVILMAGAIASGLTFIDQQPNATTWAIRLGGALAAVGALIVFLRYHYLKDRAPDYLRGEFGDYFNRQGLAFTCVWTVEHRIAYLTVFFQNQYSRPCTGEIALQPQRGLFSRRSELAKLEIHVDVGPGAFGFTKLPVPIPVSMQRSRQKFDIGASVSYPEGRGPQLRYYEGTTLRWNKHFRNSFGSLLSIAGLLGGALVWTKRAGIECSLPGDVEAMLQRPPEELTTTLWQLGDPPL